MVTEFIILEWREKVKWLIATISCFTLMVSCSLPKNIAKPEGVDIEVRNGGGFEQRGFSLPHDVDSVIRVSGIVTMYNADKPVREAEISFIDEEGNVVRRLLTDSEGKYRTTLNTDWFLGDIEIKSGQGGYLFARGVSLGQHYKSATIDFRLYQTEIFVEYMKLDRNDIKQIEKLQKKKNGK